MKGPLFSIFIPAYNRAHVIDQALDSISDQAFPSWEIIVVDDGSTDNTGEVVADWSRRHGVTVRYIYQINAGKHVAHNQGVAAARGELFMVLDSDDRLLPEALEKVSAAWWGLSAGGRLGSAGVEGLCITSSGALHGTAYPEDTWDGNYLELRGVHGVCGEKRSALRVDVLEQYPYPVFAGEYHVRPSYIWKRIAHHYSFRCINEPLQIVDFAQDGLTASASKRRLLNVQGLFAYWKDDIFHHQEYLSMPRRVKHYAEYIRYGFHNDFGLLGQWRQVPCRQLWLLALPRGISNYWGDLLKVRYMR